MVPIWLGEAKQPFSPAHAWKHDPDHISSLSANVPLPGVNVPLRPSSSNDASPLHRPNSSASRDTVREGECVVIQADLSTLIPEPQTMTPTPDLHTLLRDCYLPAPNPAQLQRNIVAAGLVRSATLTPDPDAPGSTIPGLPPRFVAHITLHAPASDDTANSQLVAQIENRLLGLPSISRVQVTLLPALFPIL